MTHLSRMQLNPSTRTCRKDMVNPQSMHKTIMSMFPQSHVGPARQHFNVLWRTEPDKTPTLLVQSSQAPDFGKLPAGYASYQTKPIDDYFASLTSGTVVAYRVVLNPVKISRRSRPERRSVIPSRDRPLWWVGIAPKVGLELIDAPVVTGQRDKLVKRKDTSFRIYSVRVDGNARVWDPDLLRRSLIEGVGRAKAWGCGLMTVARQRW